MNWFNRKPNAVLSIDISTASVKLLELSRIGANYRVDSFAVVPLPQSAVIEKNITDINVIAEAIKLAVRESGTKLKEAVVAIPESAVMTKIITMPASLTDDEMEAQIMVEADQYVPHSLDEINFDFEVLRINAKNPQLVDVLLVASRRENVDDRVDALLQAGLKTRIVDVEAYAMEHAFSLLFGQFADLKADQTIAITDIGATMTWLTVLYQGGVVYTRGQGFGGKQLTEEIQRHYGLSYQAAGLAKRQGGLPDSYAADVLEPFKMAIVQQIQRSLQFFVSSSANRGIDGIVLVGGCALIPGIDQLVEKSLAVPVYIANPFINMSLSNKINYKALSNDAPTMMVACGLALRGFDL